MDPVREAREETDRLLVALKTEDMETWGFLSAALSKERLLVDLQVVSTALSENRQ